MSVQNTLYVKKGLFVNNVNSSEFTDTIWSNLSTVDQELSTESNVSFSETTLSKLTVSGDIDVGDIDNQESLVTVHGSLSVSSNIDVSGNVAIEGNLVVRGTTTSINTTELEVKDNLIVLNKYDGTLADLSHTKSGIEVFMGTDAPTRAKLLYDITNKEWIVSGATTEEFRLAELAGTKTIGHIPVYDSDGRLDQANGLSNVIVDQLRLMSSTDVEEGKISAANWGYLSSTNQHVSTLSDVAFNSLSLATPMKKSVSSYTTAPTGGLQSAISIFNLSSSIRVTLPSNITSAGQSFIVHLASGEFTLSIDKFNESDSIEGDSFFELDTVGQHVELLSLGTGKWLVR
jgi:hypothetical protein